MPVQRPAPSSSSEVITMLHRKTLIQKCRYKTIRYEKRLCGQTPINHTTTEHFQNHRLWTAVEKQSTGAVELNMFYRAQIVSWCPILYQCLITENVSIKLEPQLSQPMRLWYLSHRQPAKAQASLRIAYVISTIISCALSMEADEVSDQKSDI